MTNKMRRIIEMIHNAKIENDGYVLIMSSALTDDEKQKLNDYLTAWKQVSETNATFALYEKSPGEESHIITMSKITVMNILKAVDKELLVNELSIRK